MITTFEVALNGNSIGEVIRRDTRTDTWWSAVSFVRGVVGGQFSTPEKAENHLLSQAKQFSAPSPAFVTDAPINWDDFDASENIPF